MRVKTEKRRRAIIDIAGKLFLEHGYAAVSMAAISAQVGGSRVTLYNYFATKELLFEACVIAAGEDVCEGLLDLPEPDEDIEKTLIALGHNLLRLSLKPEILAVHRLIIAEALRTPELSRIFYGNGPGRTLLDLMAVMATAMERKQIKNGDTRRCALHFKALCEAGLVEHQLWNIVSPLAADQIDKTIIDAVAVFLSAYRPTQNSSAKIT